MKFSPKGWKLAKPGKIFKPQHLPAKTCACTCTQNMVYKKKLQIKPGDELQLFNRSLKDCKTLLNFIINDHPAVMFVLSGFVFFFMGPSCVTADLQLQGGTKDPGGLLSFLGQIRAFLCVQAPGATQ